MACTLTIKPPTAKVLKKLKFSHEPGRFFLMSAEGYSHAIFSSVIQEALEHIFGKDL
jgi:hypothetical protein